MSDCSIQKYKDETLIVDGIVINSDRPSYLGTVPTSPPISMSSHAHTPTIAIAIPAATTSSSLSKVSARTEQEQAAIPIYASSYQLLESYDHPRPPSSCLNEEEEEEGRVLINDDESVDPMQVRNATERGRILRDLEIVKDKEAEIQALPKRHLQAKQVKVGQRIAQRRDKEGFDIRHDAYFHEESLLQRQMEQIQQMEQQGKVPKFSNVPGGGYDVASYDVSQYDGMNYDSNYEYESVYDE